MNVGDTISTLYTIAGGQASFKKGDVAVFRADKKVGNSFFFGFMNHTKEFGYMFDRLLSMKNHGVSRHLLVNYSYVFYEGARTTVYAYNDGDLYRAPRIHNVGVGYGIGFTFAHSIQMMPYACGQFDILQSKTKDGDEGYGYAQFRIPVGLKLNVNIAYPLQLTGGLEYGICFGGKSDKNERDYNALKSYFYDARGWKRNGPKAYIGLRICM